MTVTFIYNHIEITTKNIPLFRQSLSVLFLAPCLVLFLEVSLFRVLFIGLLILVVILPFL
jgi:diacylglycerol kinase